MAAWHSGLLIKKITVLHFSINSFVGYCGSFLNKLPLPKDKELDDVPNFYHLGPQLRETCLSSDLPATSFEASAIQVVQKDLMDMLVRELKEELEARDQPKTGNKAWLRRRLHGAVVRAHLAERDREP